MYPTSIQPHPSTTCSSPHASEGTSIAVTPSHAAQIAPQDADEPAVRSGLLSLPLELRSCIVSMVQATQGPVATHALTLAAKPLRAVLGVPSIAAIHAVQVRVAIQVGRFVRTPDQGTFSSAWHPQRCATLLGWTRRGSRDDVVAAALGIASERHRSTAIAGFGQALEHLTARQCKDLVESAVVMKSCVCRARAIAGLAVGMKHIHPSQRAALVTATVAMRRVQEQVVAAMRAMAGALEHLTDGQRESLVVAAIGTGVGSGSVGAASHLLNAEQRGRIVARMLALDDPTARAQEIWAIGAGLRFLSDEQVDRIIEAGLALQAQPPEIAAPALRGLVKGLGICSVSQRDDIVSASIGLADSRDRATTVGEFGAWAAVIGETHGDRLIDAAIGMALPMNRETAVARLTTGLEGWRVVQRDRLVRASLDEDDASARAGMVAGFGPVLLALTVAQRDSLVVAALGAAGEMAKAKAIQGISAGLGALTEAQRSSLVEAGLGLKGEIERAAVIEGLVSELAHLRPVDRDRVILAADQQRTARRQANILEGLTAGAIALAGG